MIIAVEVVMPWPTSIRGIAKDAVPSSSIVIVISCDGGAGSVGLQVLEVVDLGDLRRRGHGGVRRGAEAQVGGDDEGGGADDVAEETATAGTAAGPSSVWSTASGVGEVGVTQRPLDTLRPGRLPSLPPRDAAPPAPVGDGGHQVVLPRG